jgi:NADH-quinone oxidoreductase subunit M
MANIGLPGTSSFVGEFLIITGCLLTNSWCALFCASSMVLGGGYSLWLLNRICFGNIKNFSIQSFTDLNRLEFFCLLPFAVLTFLLGIFPEIITNYMSVL